MLSPTQLLEVSTQRISDKNNEVKLCPYTRLETKQGYNFVSLNRRKAKKISASIEVEAIWEHDEDIGYLRTVKCRINTLEKLKGNYCILYQDLVLFVNDFSSYTESMGQYQYNAKAVEIDKLPLIDYLNPNDKYGYSSLELVSSLDKYNVIPEYVALSDEFMKQGVYLVKVDDTRSISMLRQMPDGFIYQTRQDTLLFRCVNVTRDNVIKFIVDLLEFGQNEGLYGLIGDYNVREINNYDDFSNLRGIRYEVNITICYNISSLEEIKQKQISQILFKMNPEDSDKIIGGANVNPTNK